MANDFCHLELYTPDPQKAKEFYGKVFSWTFGEHDMGPMGTYTLVHPGEGPQGGIFKPPDPNTPTGWAVYVNVEDVDETLKKVEEAGGSIIMGKMPIPEIGEMAVIRDPTGGVISLFKSTHAPGQ